MRLKDAMRQTGKLEYALSIVGELWSGGNKRFFKKAARRNIRRGTRHVLRAELVTQFGRELVERPAPPPDTTDESQYRIKRDSFVFPLDANGEVIGVPTVVPDPTAARRSDRVAAYAARQRAVGR